MSTIDRESFIELANYSADICISIYIPTHRAGHEVLSGHDNKSFKNHLQRVKNELEDRGMQNRDIEALLNPADALLGDTEFWRHQHKGLAAFIAPGFFEYFISPVAFNDFNHINSSFHVHPLVPIISNSQKFYLLKLSKKHIAFYEATRFDIREIELEDVLRDNIKEVAKFYDIHEAQEWVPLPERKSPELYPDHMDQQKVKDHMLSEFFRNINAGIMNLVGTQNAPLVLAGVEYFHPIYREANTYPHLLEKGVTGNFDRHTQPMELHEKSWPLVEPYIEQMHRKKVEQYQNLQGTGKVSTDLEEILKGTVEGRVDTLFVSEACNVWGRFDESELKVDVHPEYRENDDCLLNVAAVKALMNGAKVYVSKNEQIEEVDASGPVAAIFRY
jgi:hypothetical protein